MNTSDDEPLWHDYRDDEAPPEEERFGTTAVFDYTPAGALMLQYKRDEAFTAVLRELVPTGFITWSRQASHWVIDADYADDVLATCRKFFDYVDHGDIE